MMSCMQMASVRPQFNLKVSQHKSRGSGTCVSAVGVPNLPSRYPELSICAPIYKRHTVVCVFGGKENPLTNNQDSPWKRVQDTFENIGQKLSVEDMLRKQLSKQGNDSEDLGGGESPPGGGTGDGGGGGYGSSGFGEPEEESFADKLDEALQKTLAILGLTMMYVYLIKQAECKALIYDITRLIKTGKKSQRLIKTTAIARFVWKVVTGDRPKENIEHTHTLLAQAIVNTKTWYDGPDKHKETMKSYVAGREVGAEENDNYSQYWRDKSKGIEEGDGDKEDGDEDKEDGDEDSYKEEGYVEGGYVEDDYQDSLATIARDDYYKDNDDDDYY